MPTVRMQRQPTIFPDRLHIPMKFTLAYISTITTGVGQQVNFNGNSIFDPAGSASAVQAVGYTTLASIYSTYTVTASAIRIMVLLDQNAGVTTAKEGIVRVVVWPATSTTSQVSTPTVAEMQPYAKALKVGSLFSFTNEQKNNQLRNYISTAKIYGEHPQNITANPNYGAAVGANPNALWFWNILVNPTNSAASLSQSVQVEVDMVQYVEFQQRKQLAP